MPRCDYCGTKSPARQMSRKPMWGSPISGHLGGARYFGSDRLGSMYVHPACAAAATAERRTELREVQPAVEPKGRLSPGSITSAAWRKFQSLTPTGKAITVGSLLVVFGLGQLFGSEEPATSAPATSTPTTSSAVTPSAAWNRMTSLNVTCRELDGMMEQAWDLGNTGLADSYESVWATDCRGRI
jgi:hypothetical protein